MWSPFIHRWRFGSLPLWVYHFISILNSIAAQKLAHVLIFTLSCAEICVFCKEWCLVLLCIFLHCPFSVVQRRYMHWAGACWTVVEAPYEMGKTWRLWRGYWLTRLLLGRKVHYKKKSSGYSNQQWGKGKVAFKGGPKDVHHPLAIHVAPSVFTWKYRQHWNTVPCKSL